MPFIAASLAMTAAAQEPIIIGQSVPLSGAAADVGRDIRDGANAVFEKVNRAGGVNGRKIQMLSLDDGNERKRAGANAQTLIEQKKALVLFGFGSATLSLDAIPSPRPRVWPCLRRLVVCSPFATGSRYSLFAPYVSIDSRMG